jgi:hypothetical protein
MIQLREFHANAISVFFLSIRIQGFLWKMQSNIRLDNSQHLLQKLLKKLQGRCKSFPPELLSHLLLIKANHHTALALTDTSKYEAWLLKVLLRQILKLIYF